MTRTPRSVANYLAEIGRKGGKVKGKSKARTREQAQKAARIRWSGKEQT